MEISKEAINRRFIKCINDLLEAREGINKSTLAQELGISKSKFSEILNNRMNAGLDVIGIFCIKYKFDPNWILTGSGHIKKNDDENNLSLNGSTTPLSENKRFYSQAHTSILITNSNLRNNFSTAIKSKDSERISVPFLNTHDFMIKENGDSMINRKNPIRSIRNNDLVACKLWKSHSHIRWGEVYALSTREGVIIKKIMPSDKEGLVKCISFNEEDGYLPYELSLDEIYDWALVVGVTRITAW